MGITGAFLPQQAVEQLFTNGRTPRVAGSFTPGGKAVAVDGGYRISGRWPWASGIRHAEWLGAMTFVESNDGNSRYPRMSVIPQLRKCRFTTTGTYRG